MRLIPLITAFKQSLNTSLPVQLYVAYHNRSKREGDRSDGHCDKIDD